MGRKIKKIENKILRGRKKKSWDRANDDALGRFVFPIDTRCRVETQFLAFASYGHGVPPRTAELKDLMLQAAREEHEENVRMNQSRPKSERVDLWQWSSPSSWTSHGIGDDGNDGDDGGGGDGIKICRRYFGCRI